MAEMRSVITHHTRSIQDEKNGEESKWKKGHGDGRRRRVEKGEMRKE